MSPETAFRILQAIESLPARMDRHMHNAEKVASFLEQAPEVAWVRYPGSTKHPQHDLARRLMPRGSGGIMAFAVKGGRPAGSKFIERLGIFSHLANVGDTRSLVIHPASTTHQQLSDDELATAGIDQGLVRLSVGLEDPADLVADLQQALAASQI